MRDLLHETADLAADFLESQVPEGPTEPHQVVAELAAVGGSAAVGIPSGRYFGFVIGGSVPAALTADWLTSAWDQNAGLYVGGPAAAVVEEVAGRWLAELLGLTRARSLAFVTGTQMAHATALAAARNHVLHELGWDVERDGLARAPRIRVLAGAKAHSTLYRALRLIGLGTASVTPVAVDDQGRMRTHALREALAPGGGPAIVCVLCAHPEPHRRAMGVQAEYLIHAEEGGPRDEVDWTPEFSRRARGFAVYAAIRSLGRSGIAAMIERCCDHAARFAREIATAGAEVLNEVSNWQTSDADVDRTLAAFAAAAE